MTIPDVQGSVTVQIPAWNTLYQIRDFAYHVTGYARQRDSGRAHRLAITKLDKQTWRITGQGEVRVEYARLLE